MLLLCFLFYLWKLTAAGGIPPLVQLLETGSVKAKEATAFVLRNCTVTVKIFVLVSRVQKLFQHSYTY
jgi:hypothetical protein